MTDEQQATPNRMKWVMAESREEYECDRLGWKLIANEIRADNSLWCLWAQPHSQAWWQMADKEH